METIIQVITLLIIIAVLGYMTKVMLFHMAKTLNPQDSDLDLTVEEYLELFGWQYRANSSLSNDYVHSDHTQFMLRVSPHNDILVLKLNIPLETYHCENELKCAIEAHKFVTEWKYH